MPLVLQSSPCSSTSQSRKLPLRQVTREPVVITSKPTAMPPLFNSFKDRLSRKSKNSSSPRDRSDPYFTSAPPPTRRPSRPGMNAFSTPSSSDAPPAYQDAVTAPAYSPAAPAATATSNSADDAYAFLSQFNTVFLIDDSGSMAGRSWRECSSALEAITPICTQHDADGIDIYFLNSPFSHHHMNVKEASTVHEIFSSVRPGGGTPTGQRLHRLLKEYLAKLEQSQSPDQVKPLNVIVITDGVPSDDIESVIIRAAKRLDELDAEPWQLGIQFVQVGEEQGAKEHLESLDDDLADMGGGCRDIVDTVPANRGRILTCDLILKVVLGAVNKRLDRRRNSSTGRR